MKPRKDNNDIENEAGHSEHDQSLVTRFASRQHPDEKDRPEECMKCEVGRSGQLAVEHGNCADTYQNSQEVEGLWYETPDNAIGNAMHNSRSHDAVIRVYDGVGHLIE